MIRIAISAEAFEAIARTLPLGSVSFESATNENGERLIWLKRAVVDGLRGLSPPAVSIGRGRLHRQHLEMRGQSLRGRSDDRAANRFSLPTCQAPIKRSRARAELSRG
jgi:hypothetical protein